METYEQTMTRGAEEYADVLESLRAGGLRAEFTQTGGMNAAIEVVLEAGYTILITDDEDSLAWARADHRGWGVGMYREEADSEALHYGSTEDGSLPALRALMDDVLRHRLAT